MKSDVLKWILRGVCFLIHLTSYLCGYILEEQTFTEMRTGLTPLLGGANMARTSKLAGVVSAFSGIIRVFLETVSPDLRKLIQESLTKWEAKAKETKNKWDDLIVDAAQAIFGFDD